MRRADPRVVGEVHLRAMRLVSEAAAQIGADDLHLDGGTALAAYHLVHRESEDLDFFGGPSLNARHLGDRVAQLARDHGLTATVAGPQSLGFVRFLVRDAGRPGDPGIKLDLAASSPYRLEPLERAEEGVLVSSYRDLCAGKLHAICDRFEPRDFIDLHAILNAPLDEPVGPETAAARARVLVADVTEIDPGLDPSRIGQALARGLGRPLLEGFPLRLLRPMANEPIQASIRTAMDVCAGSAAEGLRSDGAAPEANP